MTVGEFALLHHVVLDRSQQFDPQAVTVLQIKYRAVSRIGVKPCQLTSDDLLTTLQHRSERRVVIVLPKHFETQHDPALASGHILRVVQRSKDVVLVSSDDGFRIGRADDQFGLVTPVA